MSRIAIFCTDEELNAKIINYCEKTDSEFEPVILKEESKCLEYANYELPELCFYNFSDTILNAVSILEKVKTDPWLHYGGIIGVYSSREDKLKLEKIKNSNLISSIPRSRFDFSFPRVLRIIKNNRQILFQRHIQSQLLSTISGRFIIDNDPFDVITYSNMISNYLFNSNYIDVDLKEKLTVGLQELLLNAIEHGNCKISFEEKTEWLNQNKNIMDLILLKNQLPGIRDKKVYFEYKITPEKSSFRIQDEGDGFNWAERKQKIENLPDIMLHGRGIMMAELYVSKLLYNEKGNEVSFEITHTKNEHYMAPQVFNKQDEIIFQDKEIVFKEGEKSNFLYYIVSGKLDIISNNKIISHLSPADMFLGEMSFLLDNSRSVTVRSNGKTVLLKISKESFLNAIKTQPHYGIFLARLIAQRLQRLNQISGKRAE